MNTANQLPIEIPISKAKLLLLLLCFIIVIPMSYYVAIHPEQYTIYRFESPKLIKAIAIFTLIASGIIVAFIIFKLFDRRPGLLIDATGIVDNSSGTSFGRIHWADITGIEAGEILSNKFILLKTDQPDKYINNARNRFVKRTLIGNMKMHKSPLSISSVTLKISHDDLNELLLKQWKAYKKNQ